MFSVWAEQLEDAITNFISVRCRVWEEMTRLVSLAGKSSCFHAFSVFQNFKMIAKVISKWFAWATGNGLPGCLFIASEGLAEILPNSRMRSSSEIIQLTEVGLPAPACNFLMELTTDEMISNGENKILLNGALMLYLTQ